MKFLLADDHAIVREGMASALSDFDADAAVLEAQDALGVLEILYGDIHLDLILIDLFMPGCDGFELLREIRGLRPAVPLVVLSASEDPRHIAKAIELGASGFIPKSTQREGILSAIGLVLSGGVFIPPQITRLGQRPEEGLPASEEGEPASPLSAAPPGALLTKRQMEVLWLMGEGRSNKEIARLLGLSANTVKIHVTAVLRNLGVTNRTKAVLLARQLGLLRLD